jgi:AbrB family looped-hinge helix DNA binding protein
MVDAMVGRCYSGTMGTQKKSAVSGAVTTEKALTATVRGKGRVTIPERVRLALDVHEGERFDVSVTEDGSILLRRRIEIDPDQRWFWTAAWQARTREGLEDEAEGRMTLHESGEAFLESLAELDKQADS